MAKATTTQKKTANKKLKKTSKNTTKKTATTKAVSTRGRKLFDGKSEKVVCAKLTMAFEAGASKLLACQLAGISRVALDRYLENNDEFRTLMSELQDLCVVKSHMVINTVIGEEETVSNGKTKVVRPTSRALSTAKWNLRSRDVRYAPKNLNANIDIPIGNGGLTPEREAEIAGALQNWGTEATEEDHYKVDEE